MLVLWEPRLDFPLEPFPEWLWDPPHQRPVWVARGEALSGQELPGPVPGCCYGLAHWWPGVVAPDSFPPNQCPEPRS